MLIENFTDQHIRLGDYPHSIDVSNIKGNHSNYGVIARFCTYRTPEDGKDSFVQLRRMKAENGFWYELVLARWGEQEEELEPADVIWDSRIKSKTRVDASSVLLPCPFCGNPPRVNTIGTFIDIDCCVSMNRQKCDYLTLEERAQYNPLLYGYSEELEDKIFNIVAAEWNNRVLLRRKNDTYNTTILVRAWQYC